MGRRGPSDRVRKGHLLQHARSLVGELSAGDVQAMDFEKRYSEDRTHRKGIKTWGDREPGTRLLSHAKGVGLTQALKRLL